MKSFSRIHPPSSQPQLATWTPSDLDVEFVVSPVDRQREQLLAILHSGEKNGEQQRSKSILRPSTADLTASAWQPKEIDLQLPLQEIKEWDFVESPGDEDAALAQELWPVEPDPEKEAEEILKQARIQAEEIILEARAMADKVVSQAQDEIDSEKKEGHRQGWNEGRNQLGEVMKAVRSVLEEVHQWKNVLTTQGETILVDMLKEIAQTMFGEGVHLDANALQINLNRVMEHAQKLGDLNIFLNTGDVELLDPSWSEYQLLITGNKVKIIPSEKITPGGCLVKGSMGMIDGRVETQLAAVMNTIEEIRGTKE